MFCKEEAVQLSKQISEVGAGCRLTLKCPMSSIYWTKARAVGKWEMSGRDWTRIKKYWSVLVLLLWSYLQFIDVLTNCSSCILPPKSFMCVYRSLWPSFGNEITQPWKQQLQLSVLWETKGNFYYWESNILLFWNPSHVFCGVWYTLWIC